MGDQTVKPALTTTIYKWRAAAAQTARCRSKELHYPYCTFIISGLTEGSGTEDNHSL